MGATITPQLGKRRPDSVASRLQRFFDENPEEELTEQQAADKFSVTLEAVKMAVLALVREGALEKVKVVRRPAKGRAK